MRDIETLLRVPTLLFCHQESCELGVFDPIELNGERKEGFRPGQRLKKAASARQMRDAVRSLDSGSCPNLTKDLTLAVGVAIL